MYCSQARVHLRPTRPNHNELHALEGLSGPGPWHGALHVKQKKTNQTKIENKEKTPTLGVFFTIGGKGLSIANRTDHDFFLFQHFGMHFVSSIG
jgi:hypothetical protein